MIHFNEHQVLEIENTHCKQNYERSPINVLQTQWTQTILQLYL